MLVINAIVSPEAREKLSPEALHILEVEWISISMKLSTYIGDTKIYWFAPFRVWGYTRQLCLELQYHGSADEETKTLLQHLLTQFELSLGRSEYFELGRTEIRLVMLESTTVLVDWVPPEGKE